MHMAPLCRVCMYTRTWAKKVFMALEICSFDSDLDLRYRHTGKSLSEALLFAEHGENMLCTKIDLNVRNNFCAQTFFKIIICFRCWFWKGESNNCNMLSWMNPCYLQFICNLTEFVSHIVTPGSLKRVVEKYAKRCALESVQKWSFQLFY